MTRYQITIRTSLSAFKEIDFISSFKEKGGRRGGGDFWQLRGCAGRKGEKKGMEKKEERMVGGGSR